MRLKLNKRMLLLTIVLVVLAGLIWVLSGAPQRPVVAFPPSGPLRIEGATIVDPRDGKLTPNMAVEIDAGRIVRVSPMAAPASLGNVRRIDARGKFLVPGYNNMHVHALDRDRTGALALMLADGVTGFRQMSGTSEDLKDRREHRLPLTGETPGLLAMPGPVLIPFNAGSPEAAQSEIKRQKVAGADFIKVGMMAPDVFWATLAAARAEGLSAVGHLQPGVDPARAAREGFRSIEHLGPGDAIWIACSRANAELFAESADHPRMTAPPIQLPYLDRFVMWRLRKTLINPAAFAKPEHIARLGRAISTFDPERCAALARLFAAHHTWHVPTLVRIRNQYLADDPAYQRDPFLQYMPKSDIESWQEVTRTFRALPAESRNIYRRLYARDLMLTKLLADSGVPMMTGTDGGGYASPGQTLQQEFRELATAGLSPLKILQMTTINPAAFLGRNGRMGRIDTGYNADLVILDANPLLDVGNLGEIDGVVRAGYYHSRADLDAVRRRVATANSR
ncbi:hypothetical protein C1T17_11085 [Sphingobium sp. SCG-1]|uniref:amidohydrolase family protein n=1 Tax=Sphingobium sp. SCG-1 TaxID=2072936 RepID=UPI000CD69C70|nr:amidohydrolase family protein [Sphingobium sp. SCG-1]AUW58562.1 hypothetical protein C1T17_11085 [Sphingobium sp. SCG-1]